MEYKDLTTEQKDVRSKVWVKFLDKFCPVVLEDSRPCDLGCPCDRCQYDFELGLDNVKELKRLGQPLLDEEIKRFKDYL